MYTYLESSSLKAISTYSVISIYGIISLFRDVVDYINENQIKSAGPNYTLFYNNQ